MSEGGGFSDGGEVTSGDESSGGLLTAGDWDDNLNFELFQSYAAKQLAGSSYSVDYDTADRVTIHVTTDAGEPLSNAMVHVLSAGTPLFAGPTGSDGSVLFFPKHDGVSGALLTVTVDPPPAQPSVPPVAMVAPTGSDWQVALPGAQHQAVQALDLAFVVDTTGSMGDEIAYLQDEIQGIVSEVQGSFPGVSLRLALVVYRDHGDAYVVNPFDFTSSVADFQVTLDAQSADGGGDMPEAMDEALARVPALTWRTGEVARMAVLMADAPPHADRAQAMADQLDGLRAMGIKLYPLAASGTDPDAELLMRLGAQATGGRYMFLTDDSGFGGAHAEPTIPCYQVRKLEDVLVYEITSELSGQHAPVPDSLVIRDVGEPDNGVCKLQDGAEAYLW